MALGEDVVPLPIETYRRKKPFQGENHICGDVQYFSSIFSLGLLVFKDLPI